MSRNAKVALGLITGGIVVTVAGELLGVFGPGNDPDTITDLVMLGGLPALIGSLGLLGWAAWHFVDSYFDRRR